MKAKLSTSTTDTRIAAALGTLGFPVRPEVVYDEKPGKTKVTFHIDVQSTIPQFQGKQWSVVKLKHDLKHKQLADTHVLLDCLRGLHNRKMLVAFLKTGRGISLGETAGRKRTVFVQGDGGLPGIGAHKQVLKTYKIEVAAALAVVGGQLLAIEGQRGNHAFYFAEHGLQLSGKPENMIELFKAFNSGSLKDTRSEHPFLYAVLAQKNYVSLLAAVDRQEELILLRKPKSNKAAFVRAGASDKAFDEVKRHFGV